MIQHSPISMVKYYISKLCSTLLTFMLSHYRGLFSPGILYAGSIPTNGGLAHYCLDTSGGKYGLYCHGIVLVSLSPSAQLMSVVGNIVYMAWLF